MAAQKRAADDALAKELAAIKRLLILQLLTSGVPAKDVAAALGVHQSVVSRLVPVRKLSGIARDSTT